MLSASGVGFGFGLGGRVEGRMEARLDAEWGKSGDEVGFSWWVRVRVGVGVEGARVEGDVGGRLVGGVVGSGQS